MTNLIKSGFALNIGFNFIGLEKNKSRTSDDNVWILSEAHSIMYLKKVDDSHPCCKFTVSRHKNCASFKTKLLETKCLRITGLKRQH